MRKFRIKKIPIYFRTIFQQKNPFLYLLGNFMLMTGLNKYKVFPIDSHKIRFSKSAMGLYLFANRNDRKEEREFLKDILRTDDIVVDVGANVGTLSIPAALHCSGGKVVSIEAHPATVGFLKENIALNKLTNIIAIHTAVGNKEGSIFFSDEANDDQNKISQNQEGISVPIQTLDKLLAEHHIETITLLKIDVEGYEKFVLEGAASVLRGTNAVFFEAWDKSFAYYNYSFSDVYDLLTDMGFSVYRFQTARSLLKVERSFSAEVCQNMLALWDADWFITRTGYRIG